MSLADFRARARPTTLVLFDVDGTLTPSRLNATPEVLDMLAALRKRVVIGFVGGSDLPKQLEQLGEHCLDAFDFCFAENGLTAYRHGVQLPSQSFIKHLGEERYKQLVNFILRYLADLDIPVKRGTFVEFRNGMINVSPIGRQCSQAERNAFSAYDDIHRVRASMIAALQSQFADYGLTFAIGGQISFDVFPKGWDKTYCLRHVEQEGFTEIHFFGDKTEAGGNDHEIYTDARVTGHRVVSAEDTIRQVTELFLKDE